MSRKREYPEGMLNWVISWLRNDVKMSQKLRQNRIVDCGPNSPEAHYWDGRIEQAEDILKSIDGTYKTIMERKRHRKRRIRKGTDIQAHTI